MQRVRLLTVLTVEREAFRTAVLIVVLVAGVIALLPRLIELAAAAYR
jgi:hypothetical protein